MLGVVIGCFGELIIEFLGDRPRFDAEIIYSPGEESWTARAIYKAIANGLLDKGFAVYLYINIIRYG